MDTDFKMKTAMEHNHEQGVPRMPGKPLLGAVVVFPGKLRIGHGSFRKLGNQKIERRNSLCR